jgi:hypothetical protein
MTRKRARIGSKVPRTLTALDGYEMITLSLIQQTLKFRSIWTSEIPYRLDDHHQNLSKEGILPFQNEEDFLRDFAVENFSTETS